MTVRIVLYGGVNEIGGNKFLLEDGEHRLLLDFGTSLAGRDRFFEHPFLQPRTNSVLRDLLRLGLLPDVDGIYRDDLLTVARSATDRDLPESAAAHRRRAGRAFVDGVLLTHAHVDHFQDLTFLDPEIPVWCTPTTKRMLEAIEDVRNPDAESEVVTARLRSVGAAGDRSAFPGEPRVDKTAAPRRILEIQEGVRRTVGAFEVLALPVDHSVPGACAFLVRTPSGKRVLYTGDVRFHGRLAERTAAFLGAVGDLGPDVMLCEGTRMASETGDGEEAVERGVREILDETGGLAVAEFGWKDTTRFDTLQRAAEAAGRTLLVDPRLAYLLRRLDDRPDVPSSRIESYPNVRAYRRRRTSLLGAIGDHAPHERGYLPEAGLPDVRRAMDAGDEAYVDAALAHWRRGVTAEAVREDPSKYVVHLTYYAVPELLDLDPPRGSSWIRCTTEPYTDEQASDVDRERRWLDHFGLRHDLPATGADDAGELKVRGRATHASGHGARPDLVRLVERAGPRTLVPVHTRERDLDLFEDLGFATATFRGVDARGAGRGRCVVEL